MKLTIFHSAEGDCLLLQSADGHSILCDGGRAWSMREHVRPHLTQLVGEGNSLDAVYVSHVDQDHIEGVQQLLEDTLIWRVHDAHAANGDTDINPPPFPKPPAINGLWHNAFGMQTNVDIDLAESTLNQLANILPIANNAKLSHTAFEANNIALSIPQAIRVSRLCDPALLNIPINRLPDHDTERDLIFIDTAGDDRCEFKVGSMNFTVVGPDKVDLEELQQGWKNWLDDAEINGGLKKIDDYIKERLNGLASGSVSDTPYDLGRWNGMPGFRNVTTPNVASLVLLVEESGKRILLTGDAQQDKLLKGLKSNGYLDEGFLHVDVLKMQHHGSEHNIDPEFAKTVTADHYVFCGDGGSGNPEPDVIDIVCNSRLGDQSSRTQNEFADNRPFTFWFSSNLHHTSETSKKRKNLEKTMVRVSQRQQDSNGLMDVQIVEQDFLTLEL